MSSRLDIKRAFYPPGFKSSYQVSLNSSAPFLSELADFTLRTLLPASVWTPCELLDLKGSDTLPGQKERSLGLTGRPRSTLLLLRGNLFQSADPEQEDAELESIPFEVSFDTEFLSFEGFSHIKHKVSITKPQDFPSFLSMRDLGRVFPLEIKRMLCGIELFKPRRFSSLLTFTPTVTQSLLLDGDGSGVRIDINAHSLAGREDLPLTQYSLLHKLSEFLLKQTNFDLLSDYRKKAAGPSFSK